MADISTLQQSLINAKKVMNKVDGGISVDRSTVRSTTQTTDLPSVTPFTKFTKCRYRWS